MNGNLFARLAEGFPADRGAILIETEAGERWSFARVLDLAGRMATLLRAAGVAPGDRVAAQVEAAPETVCLYLACLQSGAVLAPLGTGAAPGDLARSLAAAEPRVLVCDPAAEGAAAPAARAAGTAVYTLAGDGSGRLAEEARALPSDRAVTPRSGGDAAVMLATGGAAAILAPEGAAAILAPAGAALSHDALWSCAAMLHWRWGFRPGDVAIQALPLDPEAGFLLALNLVLMNGGRAILAPGVDPERILALLPQASVLMAPAGLYPRLLASPRLTRAACAGMRLFVSGAPLPATIRAAFEARAGRPVLARDDAAGIPEAAAGARGAGLAALPPPG